MTRTTLLISALTIVLFACSDKDDRVIVQDKFANGQPKTTVYKTIDDNNTYYEFEYDSLGRIKKITPYSNHQINGTKVYFRDNMSVRGLLPYKDGKRDGFTYEFYERQQTAFKGESKNDEFNGLSTWFYKDGSPEETGVRTNGKKEGEWIQYYENGQMKAKGTYINDIKQNDWTYWNNDGTTDSTTKE